jgi:hypothetical protein
LRIIKIDSGRRRMGLSLKRVDSAEYVDQDWVSDYAEATATEGKKERVDEPIVEEEAGLAEVDEVSSPTSELSETESVEAVAA